MATLTPRIRRTFGLALLLGALSPFACSDETVDIPEELIGKPYCMIVGSWGHYADGTVHLIMNATATKNPAGCACARQEERWSPETLAMLNDLALEACKEAATHWDFEWDECQEDYDAETWIYSVMYVGEDGEDTYYLPPDLHCTEG